MKKILSICTVLLGLTLMGCKKDENKVFFEGGEPPVLTSSATSLNLNFANEDDELVRLSWTNPNYMFNTGVSSHNVSYNVEIDIAGSNFNSGNKQTVSVSQDLSVTFTVGQFNDYLMNQLLFAPGDTRDVEIRVVASLGNPASAVLSSNVLRYTVTPYAIPPKVDPPASGNLYITGAATPAGWMGGGDAELLSQKFTRVSETIFEIPSIELNGGESYLFVPVYGNWSAKYGYIGSNNENNVNGDDFQPEGGDMRAPAVSGAYKITVDFQRGKFTVTQL